MTIPLRWQCDRGAFLVNTIAHTECFAYRNGIPHVHQHPIFLAQVAKLIEDEAFDTAGEVMALVDALENHGHLIEGDTPEAPPHPLVISRFQTFALRRTPPTDLTPYANHPPVLRIFYVWFDDARTADECAVIFEMGDKANTPDQHQWYPPIKERIELEHIPDWERRRPHHKARIRRTR